MTEFSKETPRSAERLMIILEALSQSSSNGMRLTDIVEITGLGKTTAHRLLNGLAENKLVDFDSETNRFYLGMKMLSWASAAKQRFSFARMAEPALARLARKTQDTVYLIVKSGDHAVCLDSLEGSHPIKVLTLSKGDSRPLGIGAGSLAILSALPNPELERVLSQQAKERAEYAITDKKLREIISTTRQKGYAYNDIHVFKDMENVTGMAAVATVIKRSDGMPVAALHITSITSRLTESRQQKLVEHLRAECAFLESEMMPVLENVAS